MSMGFGWNENEEHRAPEIAAQVPGATMLRRYGGDWSNTKGRRLLLSHDPDPVQFLAGQLDAEYQALFAAAPAGSLFTAWHERDKHRGPTSAQAQAIDERMMHLVTPYPNVMYGPVITELAGALWVGRGCHYYGVDLYNLGHTGPAATLSAWSDKMPPAHRVVAECNDNVPAQRPWWFTRVYSWLAAPGNQGLALLTFWLDQGKLSGPWLQGDAATIATLTQIAKEASL